MKRLRCAKDFTLTPATESADNTFDTDLIASDGTVTTESNLYYAFTDKVGNKPGFKIVLNGVTIPANGTIYNLAGQRVSKDYKGVIIVG